MTLFPKSEETIFGVSQMLRDGRLSCVDVVETALAHIDDSDALIQAWVLVDYEGARAQAHRLDDDLSAGRWHGPLHGIPIGIKDIIDVAGFPTAAGSKLLAKQRVETDAVLVKKLREAGAVILGKTVTTQFACFDPPVTRNPWNVAHTPGGSSSGSAAAVAAQMCLGAIGSQTGGSITRPASFCGLAGCKPTFETVSVEGVFPISKHLDHPGPIARCLRDAAILLDAISESDRLQSIYDSIEASPPVAPTIGRLRSFFDERAEPSMQGAMQTALEVLQAAGAKIVETPLPDRFNDLHKHHLIIMAADAAKVHAGRLEKHPDDYLPRIRDLLEKGEAVTADDYTRALEHQQQTRHDVAACFEGVEILACPATLGPAPDVSTTGDPAFNSPWSYTGLPTVSFPIGLADNGLPLAIQLVGPPHGEIDLFRAGVWCEDVIRQMGSMK